MKKLSILVLFWIAFTVVGCTNQGPQWQQWNQNQQWQVQRDQQNGQQQEWQQESEEQKQARQQIQKAVQNNDLSLCDELSNQQYRSACKQNVIMYQAQKQADSAICEQLEDETMQTRCNDIVIMSQAMQKQDASICEQLESGWQAAKEQKVSACKQRVQWAGTQRGIQQQAPQWQ